MTPPRMTHATEMAKISELNRRLGDQPTYPEVTADQLGLTGSDLTSPGTLPASAVLDRLYWEGQGSSSILGRFSVDDGSIRAGLNTSALTKLSELLGVSQAWGV